MAHKLVIVESPKKAQMLGGFLGDDYVVESSIGHIRDLPQSAADTPAKIIAKQGVKGVDATSNATITSEAIINGTAKALASGAK